MPHEEASPTDQWYNRIYAGVQAMAREMGYKLEREVLPNPVRMPLDRYDPPAPSRVGGVILYGTYDEQYMDMFRSEGVPLVVVDYWARDLVTDCVVVDVEAEAYALVEDLAGKGHTSLGFVAVGRMAPRPEAHEYDPDVMRMLDSLRKAAQRERIEIRDEWVLLVPTREHLGHVVRGYLGTEPRPTSLLCFQPAATAAILEVMANLSLRCPEDISLVTRGGSQVGGTDVTSLVSDPEMMGRLAVKILSERMLGLRSRPVRLALVSQIVRGETTGPAPRRT
jgi:DNA-binding LacI/PurR family transcriptional regulator